VVDSLFRRLRTLSLSTCSFSVNCYNCREPTLDTFEPFSRFALVLASFRKRPLHRRPLLSCFRCTTSLPVIKVKPTDLIIAVSDSNKHHNCPKPRRSNDACSAGVTLSLSLSSSIILIQCNSCAAHSSRHSSVNKPLHELSFRSLSLSLSLFVGLGTRSRLNASNIIILFEQFGERHSPSSSPSSAF
jgi:hypothetical protein